jgi:4-coumarate--CoA ligase (photoactive yellow protein activation family)
MSTSVELHQQDFYQVLASLIPSELKKLGHLTVEDNLGGQLSPSTLVNESGLGADSYDRMVLAGMVNQMFHIFESGIEDNLLRAKTLQDWASLVAQSWAFYSEEITFFTSGSTGTPKPCHHRFSNLIREAEFIRSLFPNTTRIVALVPSHHIYGFLWTVLLPKVMTVPVVYGQDWSANRLKKELQPHDLIVSFPLHWDYLLRSGLVIDPAFQVQGVCSTGPCASELVDALLEKGLSGMTEIYGSSETGGIGYRHHPESPYSLFPYWQPQDEALLDLENSNRDPLPLPDIVRWTSERMFEILRRRDHAVQVGGVNVFPERVAQVIRELDFVEDCAVRLMEHPQGNRLKTLIVLKEGQEPTDGIRKTLHEWIQTQLTPPERPKSITFSNQLERNALGKITEWSTL